MSMKLVDEGAIHILTTMFGASGKMTQGALKLITDVNALADTDTNASGHTVAAGGGYATASLYPVGGSAPAAVIPAAVNLTSANISSVNSGTGVITTTASHNLVNGQPIVFSGTPPTGLSVGTTYYAIVVSGTTFKAATSYANALAGTAITLSSTSTAFGLSTVAYVYWPAVVFTFTGALTGNAAITGYQLADFTNSKLLVEENTTNFTPANNGDTYTVNPMIMLGNGTPT